jgi:hypothetical protein
MNDTTTAAVMDRVTTVLARHFEAGTFSIAGATGGTAAFVTAGTHRERLAQCAATLRENGFIVADRSDRGHLYVRDHGPAHGIAMARETAGILARGYGEHLRLHGPDRDSVTMIFDTGAGGGLTVEREGHLYDVTVTPRAEAGS